MRISNIYMGVIAGLACLMSAAPAMADTPESVVITRPTLDREGGVMNVSMGIEFCDLRVKSSGAMILTPMIVNELDTLKLPSVGVYGRTGWYMADRNRRMPLGGSEGSVIMYDKNLAPIDYAERVRYAEWMNGAQLIVKRTDYGCAGCSQSEGESVLAQYRNVVYTPVFIYREAVAERVKSRELSGRAYIDFPVNRTEIHPDYRRNSVELAKIIGTIDSVKNDSDITVTLIEIKGYASPEGDYANNERLARGRTEALRNYVQGLYHFPAGFIKTDYEPEDWAGLREYVAGSTMAHRDEILAIIDDPVLDIDIKDRRIQARYGDEYRFLLANVYPGLRHSDYRIEYTIRTFSDPAEIRRLLRTAPQKLSLNEIYLAAQGLEPGSDEYNEIFETAVHLFPADPVANLNAANAAMQRGDLTSAARYLASAGDSAEATYARGVYAALRGDYGEALRLVEQAVREGWRDTAGVLDHLHEVAKYN